MTLQTPEVLLIEGSDFETFPVGGRLTMARAMMQQFAGRLALVGINREGEPAGAWIRKEVDGRTFSFFPVCTRPPAWREPLLPPKVTFISALARHKQLILESGCRAAFIQAPEALVEASRWGLDHLCYWFTGLENHLGASRSTLAKPLWWWFDRAFFSALERADLVLAAADDSALHRLIVRSNRRLRRERVVRMPACVDCMAFHPGPAGPARAELGLPHSETIFVQSGRISRLKGWDLVLDSFAEYLRQYGDALLLFAGDGEDREALTRRAAELDLASRVVVMGFLAPPVLRTCLNAANVAVFGSMVGGGSVSLLEALACGRAVVSTPVSGAGALVAQGKNGYLVDKRHPAVFAQAMNSALRLAGASEISLAIAARHDISLLSDRISTLWPPLARAATKSIRWRAAGHN
jgi:glycosyltransferase involved in cell wall biosynthesis